ncbi:MAG TPA: sulfatase-like hydrolase/transferase [Sedimentisphaerales bacterium]|nr:sulfatase-like hydrolase/transferase [Sedimentisphaerales bacterium]
MKIDRRVLLKTTMAQTACLSFPFVALAQEDKEKHRPNILWISVEDTSLNLGCYGDSDAITPTLDQMARGGTRYTNSFAVAPVCTPSRCSIITGMYASSLGAQHLRHSIAMPGHILCFTEYLRKAGYYCTNNSKQDYNFNAGPQAWDESSKNAHWRKGPKGKPFFSVFNFECTHQSKTRYNEDDLERINAELPENKRHDPQKVAVWPFYPDTHKVRVNIAAYHTQITIMDELVRGLLDQLDADGFAEDTIVFFFSDHGMGLPRGKRWLHDGGLRVPLIVRFPKKYEHLAPGKPGNTEDRLVSFVDYAPTMLSLLGIEIPKYMEGRAFLGEKDAPRRKWVLGIRDRVDEVVFCSRTIHDGRYQYIRNFKPHRPRMSYCEYSERTQIRQELRRLDAEGKLKGNQAWLMQRRTPPEEFYDTKNDPYQFNNLALDPKYAERIKGMRTILRQRMSELYDASMHAEMEVVRQCRKHAITPYAMVRSVSRQDRERILELMFMTGTCRAQDVMGALDDKNASVRYWAAVSLAAMAEAAAPAKAELLKALQDESQSVRVPAAEALCNIGLEEEGMPALIKIAGIPGEDCDSALAVTALYALGDKVKPYIPDIKKVFEANKSGKGMGMATWKYILRTVK